MRGLAVKNVNLFEHIVENKKNTSVTSIISIVQVLINIFCVCNFIIFFIINFLERFLKING